MKPINENLSENVNGGESKDSVELEESNADGNTHPLGLEPYRFEKMSVHEDNESIDPRAAEEPQQCTLFSFR